jgi:hypothetical protein
MIVTFPARETKPKTASKKKERKKWSFLRGACSDHVSRLINIYSHSTSERGRERDVEEKGGGTHTKSKRIGYK